MFLVSLVLVSQSFALSLRTSDDVFTQPVRGSLQEVLSQITVSGLEAGLAYWVWPNATELKMKQYEAEKQVALLRDTPISVEQKQAMLQGYSRTQLDKSGLRLQLPAKPNVPTVADRIHFLVDADVVTAAERQTRIETAQQVVVTVREAALEEARQAGHFRWIRGVRKLGTALLIADTGGRVYVWGQLGANPGLSPLGGYTAAQISALMGY